MKGDAGIGKCAVRTKAKMKAKAGVAYYWRVEEHEKGECASVRLYGGRPYESAEEAFAAMMKALEDKRSAFPKGSLLEYIIFESETFAET